MSETPEMPAAQIPAVHDAQADPGGDPVCWLHLVCESCGALLEHEGDEHRAGCDAAR